MKLYKKIFLSCLFYLACFVSLGSTYTTTAETTLKVEKEVEQVENTARENEESALESEKKKKKRNKIKSKSRVNLAPVLPVAFNTSIQNNTYRDLNWSFIKHDLAEFKDNNRRWNYKILSKQLEDVFRTMNEKNKDYNTIFGDRAYMVIFMNNFNLCDSDKDQVLNYNEFKSCMMSDDYLSAITPPLQAQANQQNYTTKEFFLAKIFDIMDPYHNGYMNFHGYMEFRLMVFSWRKCTVLGPFIEEIAWECALDVVSSMKTMSRPTLRNTYAMCLEISNSWNVRTIDFISFLYFATSARLYGRINGKSDGYITSKLKFLITLF